MSRTRRHGSAGYLHFTRSAARSAPHDSANALRFSSRSRPALIIWMLASTFASEVRPYSTVTVSPWGLLARLWRARTVCAARADEGGGTDVVDDADVADTI